MTLHAGETFAGYTIVRQIGSGGMGEVYLAQHPRLPRQDALKVLRPDISTDHDFRRRFIREADLAASLTHPHIVTVHDRGEFHGQLWIATQYIAGPDADQLLHDRYPAGMRVEEATAIITAIAEALDYSHGKGLVHRDVKPANILLFDPERAGRRQVYLADFGIARPLSEDGAMTATNTTFGTFAYSAPEQLMGQELDGRADQYALAATAFHLLTGTAPFTAASNPVAVISQHLNAAPPPLSKYRPELAPLDDALGRGLAKEPTKRYPTCVALASAITERVSRIPASPASATTQAAEMLAPSAPTKPAGPAPPAAPPKPPTPKRPTPKPKPPTPKPPVKPPKPPAKAPAKPSAKLHQPKSWSHVPTWREPIQEDDQANSYGFFWALAAITAVGAAIITLAIRNNDEPPPTPSYTDAAPPRTAAEPPPTPSYVPAPARTAIAARGGAGQLPTFAAPAGLGSNCQYQSTPERASRDVTAPYTGAVPTDPATISVSMVTNQGNIGLILNNAEAPCTVNNFASLAQKGFFNDTVCHRLTTAASLGVLQCGDPSATGGGGPGYQFANEYPTNQYPGDEHDDPALRQPLLYPRGTLAMANAGPDTNGSQFFMVYKDSQLPPNYTVFGTIDATGLATLDKIAATGVAGGAEDGKPATEVKVNSILLD